MNGILIVQQVMEMGQKRFIGIAAQGMTHFLHELNKRSFESKLLSLEQVGEHDFNITDSKGNYYEIRLTPLGVFDF